MYHFHGFKINSPNILIYNNYGFTKKIIKIFIFLILEQLKNSIKINTNFTQSSERFRIKTIYYFLRFNILKFDIKNR